jgi:hypothetical protein
LVSTLFGTISDSGTWLVDSGASHHMIGPQELLTSFLEEDLRLQVELDDNGKYAIKRVGTTLFQLDSKKPIRMSDVLYVSGLKKNLLSISSMEDRGYVVELSGGNVLACLRGSSIDST